MNVTINPNYYITMHILMLSIFSFYHLNTLFFPILKLSCSSLLHSGISEFPTKIRAKDSFTVFINQ